MKEDQAHQGTSGGAASHFIVFLFVLLFTFTAYHYKNTIETKLIPQPCTTPLTYRIDSFDNRFGISHDRFKQAISDAAQIWDRAAGKQLFLYDSKGAMSIDLIYDSRQQATDQLKKLNIGVDSTQNSYNKLSATYKQYQTTYATQKQQLETAQQQYNSEKQAYEQSVQDWNSKGGAPKQAYEQLNAQREQLNAEAQTLNQKSTALNQLADTINALVTTLNRVGSELNLDVSAYNSIGQNLNEFQEGVYSSDGYNQKIEIYQFNDYAMLVRVLAHELGHSLGMEHVTDPNAIMYKLNQSKNAAPTQSDANELKHVCKI